MANPSQVSRIAEIVSNIIRCFSTADVKAIRLADKWLSDLAGDHLFHTVEVNYSKWQDRTSRVAACRIARWARVLKLDLRKFGTSLFTQILNFASVQGAETVLGQTVISLLIIISAR